MRHLTDTVFFARAVAAAIVLLGLASCSSGQAQRASSTNPLAGQLFYVDPHGPAAEQARQWRSEGRTAEASAIERIATEPVADWLTSSSEGAAQVSALTTTANEGGRSALLVLYNVPGRDCGSFSAGGTGSGSAYRSWIDQVAAGISSRRATVILEPDAIAQAISGCLARKEAVRERYALLRYAVGRLKAEGHVTVYLDAGNPGWIKPVSKLVKPLRRAGVLHADGFALNVSNFYTTQAAVAYGDEISSALGGAHFVVDTGRNGNGPDTNPHEEPAWCNPPGRALGKNPTTSTGQSLVDAYLWIKQPGDSDGACRPGAPAAGAWWPQYALELAHNAGG